MTYINPYSELEHTPLWGKIASALDDLAKNKDLSITTSRDLVIGYITEKVLGND